MHVMHFVKCIETAGTTITGFTGRILACDNGIVSPRTSFLTALLHCLNIKLVHCSTSVSQQVKVVPSSPGTVGSGFHLQFTRQSAAGDISQMQL